AGTGERAYGWHQDAVVLIPLSTAKKKVLGTTQPNPRSVRKIEIKIWPGEDMDEAEAQIRALLRQRHRQQPGDDDDFKLGNLTNVLETKEQAAQIMTYLLAAIASVSLDRKSTRLNSSHVKISYAVFCLKKKKKNNKQTSY